MNIASDGGMEKKMEAPTSFRLRLEGLGFSFSLRSVLAIIDHQAVASRDGKHGTEKFAIGVTPPCRVSEKEPHPYDVASTLQTIIRLHRLYSDFPGVNMVQNSKSKTTQAKKPTCGVL